MSQVGNTGAKNHPMGGFEETLTRVSEQRFSDINLIMKKYAKTGVLPPATREGFFADVSKVGDYREAIARVQQADELFMNLDASVRKKFDNDAATFLDYVSDPANADSLEELGLIAPEVPTPAPVDRSPPLPKVEPEPVAPVAEEPPVAK